MPSLIISTNDDGSVSVAPIEATSDMLADAETFGSMDEAVQAAGEVLGQDNSGEAAPQPGAEGGQGMPGAGAEAAGGEVDALMQEGFNRAKKGQ